MNLAQYLTTSSQYLLAKDLGVSQGLVSQWILGKTLVSPKKCVHIERITNGQVTRQDLRPNDYWELWPDLTAPQDEVPSIPEDLRAVLPQLKNCGRLKDDRAIAQFLNLPPATRLEVFNTTPPNQLITEALCLKAKQALSRGRQ